MKKGRKSYRILKTVMMSVLFVCSFCTGIKEADAEKMNMSYLYFGDTDQFIQKVEATNQSVDTVSPSYLDLFPDGTLDEKVDPVFVETMHEMNVKVVPFLSNHWDREKGRAALENREALAEIIIQTINQYQLDGIHLDLENLTEEDRDQLTDFVRILREGLPKDKEVSIAVAANPGGWNKGWQGSYDYAKLAEYSDYLMLMTYDESYYGSNPGPVASLTFVEKSIQNALEQGVPNDKLVLGIPFYGRYWPSNGKGGRGISLDQAEELIQTYGGKTGFDENSKSPYAMITIPNGAYPTVYGRTLDPGKYTIWYENDLSYKYKLRLVQKYNLLGTGSWSLTEVPSEVWDYYQTWLQGEHFFIDGENHWAEYDILSMLDKGWMLGTSEDFFSPNQPLTRAQGTVVLVRALNLQPISGEYDYSLFRDVDKDYWAKKEIEIAYQHGLIKGIDEGLFAPNQPLTREQMAAILSRVSEEKGKVEIAQTVESPFKDVKTDHWAYQDILLLNQKGILQGYEDGNFYPQNSLTRAQMAAMMNRISSDFLME